jgi:hypothetical protein
MDRPVDAHVYFGANQRPFQTQSLPLTGPSTLVFLVFPLDHSLTTMTHRRSSLEATTFPSLYRRNTAPMVSSRAFGPTWRVSSALAYPRLHPWTQPRPSDPRVLLLPLSAVSVVLDTDGLP